MDKTTVTCSRCGAHREINRKPMFGIELIDDGWNSYGSALYCPSCVGTWAERNAGKKLAGDDNTLLVVVEKMLSDAEAEISRLRESIDASEDRETA